MKLKTEVERLGRQMNKLNDKKYKFNQKIDAQYEVIKKKQFKIELRLSHLKTLIFIFSILLIYYHWYLI